MTNPVNPTSSSVPMMSGWQGMGSTNLATDPADPTGAIMSGNSATGPFATMQSPTLDIQPGGSPQLGTLASLGMLAMLA